MKTKSYTNNSNDTSGLQKASQAPDESFGKELHRFSTSSEDIVDDVVISTLHMASTAIGSRRLRPTPVFQLYYGISGKSNSIFNVCSVIFWQVEIIQCQSMHLRINLDNGGFDAVMDQCRWCCANT